MNRQEWACPTCGQRWPDEGELALLCTHGHRPELARRVELAHAHNYNENASRLLDKRLWTRRPDCPTCGEDPFFCEHDEQAS